MSQKIDTLAADVAANTDATQAAATLLGNLKTSLDDAIKSQQDGDDGAALAELSAALESNTSALAAAVTANTPVASTPPTDTAPTA